FKYRLPNFILSIVVIIVFGESLLFASDNEYMKHLNRGRLLFNQGREKEALAEYRKALRFNPEAKEPLINLAIIHKNIYQYAQSMSLYKKLLQIAPDKTIYANLGEVYYLSSSPQEAIGAFNTGVALGETRAYVYFLLGRCFQETGELEKAAENFEKAVELDDTYAVAYLYLGYVYKQRKMRDKAQGYFEKALIHDPNLTQGYREIAELHFHSGRYEEALQNCRRFNAIYPQDTQAKVFIDKILKVGGDDLKEKLAAKEKKRYLESEAKIVVPKKVKDAPLVRVLIEKNKQLRFKCRGKFAVFTKGARNALFKGTPQALYALVNNQGRISISTEGKKLQELDGQIIIVPEKPEDTILVFEVGVGTGDFWASRVDRAYRGKLDVKAEGNELTIVNIVNIEEYLYGVVPSEMPSSWPQEALRAQAVAARSEVYKKLFRHKQEGYDFCSGVHCQVYGGTLVETEATCSAVDETAGLVAVCDNKPIDAVYSNSCGGHTQNNVFGQREDISYFQGRPDSGGFFGFVFPLSPLELEDWLWGKDINANCNNKYFSRSSNFRWIKLYTVQELQELINDKKPVGRIISIKILERNKSSHIQELEIIGSKGRLILSKELDIRKTLGGLRSSMFNIDVKIDKYGRPKEFLFYGGGWGHAVGMCQVGAATMAQKGATYREILNFYYASIEIKKMY
ncbi:MAG: SpoIID/LytB domain-containing protein, partial [Candidatus Omnitrophica bacterium]|nr:SpoIID/LytB domain-containing protein [Candidatus Omnitrophota bacterium]